jgi:UDP-N-acetylmuramoyl-L-alanyl-D-glutamate--2,6-diaminopimelate ligase
LKSKSASLEVLGFGKSAASDLRYEVLDQGFWGVCFKLTDSSGSREVRIQMPGIHNVQNAIVAYAAGVAAGCQPDDVIRVLAELKGVAGRLERVANTRQLNVFVDYAHTDDALRSILGMLDGIRREMRTHAGTVDTHAKIITVFGCGGDRDRGKRPLMMRAALDGSDEVILTSDNPRTEDPERILDDAMAAVSTAEHVKVRRYVDRRTAIGKAIELARPGDVVLIAGKGHETTQTIGTVKHPFSDANVAREIMEGKV